MNELLRVLSTFKPVKGELSKVNIYKYKTNYIINIEIDEIIFIEYTVPKDFNKYEEYIKIIHDTLNSGLESYKSPKGFKESNV